jgi:DNA invertase Pin-like site-specific DNA recombinase/uncharacterized Zn finger protein (UPF0148 family)
MADKPYQIAIMVRVSTEKQGEKPMSLPYQFEACREYAIEHGWKVVEEIEDRYSGMKWDRPGLLRAIALARQNQIDGVLALNHDRLARDNDVRGWFKVELRQHNVRIHYTEEPDEPHSPESRFSDDVLGAAARYLRDKGNAYMTSGRVARVHDGRILHNGSTPYGYQFNADKTQYLEDPVEAPWIVKIFERYADGWSPNQIAAWMNQEPGAPKTRRAEKWGRSAINGILTREDYTGRGTRLGWEEPVDEHGRSLSKRRKKTGEGAVEMAFPQLVSPELWRRAQAMRKEASHHTSYGKTDPNAALFKGTGRVICAWCGKPMAFESQQHDQKRKTKGLYRCKHPKCTNRASLRRATIDDGARAMIYDMVMGDEWLESRYEVSLEVGGELDQEVEKATKAEAELAKKKKRLQARIADAADDDLLYEPLAEQLRTIQAQLFAAQKHETDLVQQRAGANQNRERLKDFGKWLVEHRAGFDALDIPGLRRLAAPIDLKVYVFKRPCGMTWAEVRAAIHYDLSDWGFTGDTEPNELELERVQFDVSPRSHSNQHGHRSGRGAGEPMCRPSGGIPRNHRRWE